MLSEYGAATPHSLPGGCLLDSECLGTKITKLLVEGFMSDQAGSSGPVFVAHYGGNFHVLQSVAAFPENPTSDDDKAAVEQLSGVLNGAQVAPVDPSKLVIPALLFAVGC